MDRTTSRRGVLRALGAGGLAVGLAGCLGLGGSGSTPTPSVDGPAGLRGMTFLVEYDDSAGEVTLTVADPVDVSPANIYVEGDALGETGSWAELGGDATGSDDGDTILSAFDTLTIPADSDPEVSVVYRADGDSLELETSRPTEGN